jgi:hypothetical protein
LAPAEDTCCCAVITSKVGIGAWWTKNQVVALMPKSVDVRRREGRVCCADLLMDVNMWWRSCEVCDVQVGALCPERSRFTHSGENGPGLAGEAIMLRMDPWCVRMMMPLAPFAISFTKSYLYHNLVLPSGQ